ncbi:tail fiber assembly protein [Aeromonas veronii]|uniref:tail fiber assembly protein n=1 Tax=Aeromonas veronii TaxID=654 RepID=UPI003435EC19
MPTAARRRITRAGHLHQRHGATDTDISPPPATEQQLLEQAMQIQQQKLKEASVQMEPLIYLDSLGQLSAQETKVLHQWRQYTVEVSSANQQPGWPSTINWPVKPG